MSVRERSVVRKPIATAWTLGVQLSKSIWRWVKRRVLELIAWFRSLAIVFSITFATGTAARAASIPSTNAWSHDHPLPWIWIGSGLITGTRYVIVDLDRRKRKRKAALDDACREVAAHIDKHCTNLPLRYVGIQIWLIHRGCLRRASRFLIEDRRPSSVAWTRGKGVFGVAWQQKAPVIMDLDADLYQRASTEAEFNALPDEIRLGLAWDEVQRTRRYKVVYAAPLFNRDERDPKIVGLLSVDCLRSGHYEELCEATFDNHDFNNDILGLCEAALVS